MEVINLFAGPGCGKSTLAAGIFSLLKFHGVLVELVTEYAKDLTWEERHFALSNQSYVWANQRHRMLRVAGKVDVLVTDSPLLLGVAYSNNEPEYVDRSIIESFNEFDNINYYLNREKPYVEVGRNHTKHEAFQLDSYIRNILITNRIKFKEVPGDWMSINMIAEDVIGKELSYCFEKIINDGYA
jgi:hypothetical protein